MRRGRVVPSAVFARRWTRLVGATCVAATLSAGPASARAQPADAAASQDAKLAEAKRLYEAGSQDYNLGNFAAAIEKFEAAYSLTRATPLLYNIAQAYTRRHEIDPDPAHLRKAKALFGNFIRLSEASGEDVRDARERVTQIEEQLAALGEPEPEPEPEQPPAPEGPPPPDPTPPPEPARRPYRPGGLGIAGYATMIAGLAVGSGLAATGFVSAARSEDQRAEEGQQIPLSSARAAEYDESVGKSHTLAYAGIGAGAALVVVGVALIAADAARGRRTPARARLGPAGLAIAF